LNWVALQCCVSKEQLVPLALRRNGEAQTQNLRAKKRGKKPERKRCSKISPLAALLKASVKFLHREKPGD
jgi:hypothetical protein